VRGGDETDAPPNGWLVIACFHTLWSSASVKILPAIVELVPVYQEMASFLSIRADGQGVVKVSKNLKIKIFPTIIVLRGGKELERIEGDDRPVERLVRCLSQNLTDMDKSCHAKYKHRLRLEKALEMGLEAPSEEEEERGQLSWTWDPEQCGESLQVKRNGMIAVLSEESEEEEEEKAEWQYSNDGRRDWTNFSPDTTEQLEKLYVEGTLYSQSYAYLTEVQVYLNSPQISSYEVTGLTGYLLPSYNSIYIRRKGDRKSVPFEDQYLSKEQKERDRKSAEMKEKYEIYKRQMREQRIGRDVEAIRGSIGMLPNTGVHTWTFRWNHEPGRGGKGDSFGICSDGCESWGPNIAPVIGGSNDTGTSIGLYATGELFHNGNILHLVPGSRAPVETVASPAPSKLKKVDNDEGTEEDDGGKPKPVQIAPLFGIGSLVRCDLDTGLDGGTLIFTVNGVRLDEYAIKNVYTLLGGTEIFPVITLCQLDPLIMEKTPDGQPVPLDSDVVQAQTESPPTDGTQQTDEEKAEVEMKNVMKRFASVTLLPHDDGKENKPLDVSSTDSNNTTANVAGDSSTTDATVAPVSGESDKSGEEPIDRIRWMYETENGWILYPQDASKLLEEASRDGKVEFSLPMTGTSHKITFESKKGRDDSGKEFRTRRHVASEGIPGLWEVLSFKYEKQMGLSGQGLIKVK
jgi:hypothetical protein